DVVTEVEPAPISPNAVGGDALVEVVVPDVDVLVRVNDAGRDEEVARVTEGLVEHALDPLSGAELHRRLPLGPESIHFGRIDQGQHTEARGSLEVAVEGEPHAQ